MGTRPVCPDGFGSAEQLQLCLEQDRKAETTPTLPVATRVPPSSLTLITIGLKRITYISTGEILKNSVEKVLTSATAL